MVTIEEAKTYLRCEDTNDDDGDINSFIAAADRYVTNAAGEGKNESELYNLAVKMLVSHWYFNREPIGEARKLAFALDSILFQLKYEAAPEVSS